MRPRILGRSVQGSTGKGAAAVASSMECREHGCQVAGGEARDRLAGFRRDVYRCLWRRADALFETAEAVLTASRPAGWPCVFGTGASTIGRP